MSNKGHSSLGISSDAETDKKTSQDAVKLYTLHQATISAFLGGPLAAMQIIRTNFLNRGENALARQCTVVGLLIFFSVTAMLPFLPEAFPHMLFPLAFVVITSLVMKNFHPTKQQISEAHNLDFYSNWNVVAISAIALVISALVAVPWIMVASG